MTNHVAKLSNPRSVFPRVDLARCEGKADCVRVCPVAVFEVRKATASERLRLGLIENLKSAMHGHRKAFVVAADACRACGRCVQACPENAITLIQEGGLS